MGFEDIPDNFVFYFVCGLKLFLTTSFFILYGGEAVSCNFVFLFCMQFDLMGNYTKKR